jgi:glycosyltransferase involved in cell wall biosynthesis
MSDAPLFTVFTPTYNRAHTLSRAFESLNAQTLRSFEWLVVDDGSTDNTPALIADWIKIANFPIRYFRQTNSGKHIAHNFAVKQAHGTLFAPLDSDDALVPNALERISTIWNDIPASERELFSGIGSVCRDQDGAIIGDLFPANPFDSNLREIIYKHRIRGEKWGITRTDIFRCYPFPEIAGTQFVPEGLVGLQMSRQYRRRYVNEVFRIYYRHEYKERGNNLTDRVNLAANANGRLPFYLWLLNNELEYFWRTPIPFLKAATILPIVAHVSGKSIGDLIKSAEKVLSKALIITALPFAVLIYIVLKVTLVINGKR